MLTQHDYYEALREGRWRPEIEIEGNETEGYKAKYVQNKDNILEVTSPYRSQVEDDLMAKLYEGILDGKYYPELD